MHDPIFQLNFGNFLEMPGASRDEREFALDGDGGDAKVRIASTDARFFHFRFESAEEDAAFPVERKNFERRENFLFECLQYPALFGASVCAKIDFSDIDGAGVLCGGWELSQLFQEPFGWTGFHNIAEGIPIEQIHQISTFRSVSRRRAR
ncbi:MAG: hypothetical protein ACLFTV_17425 [Desulfococcaceae bacterium]